MQLIAPCLFGLEGLAGDELRRLGMADVRVEDRRVLFTGDENALAKANICLRTGERIMVVLAQFEAKSFEELFQGVYHTNLEDYIPKDGQFPVKGHCLNSQLMSVSDCQAIIKKAASRRLGEKYGVGWLPETGMKFQLHFTVLNDKVTLSLDTSGQGLHKRGYRAIGNDAPLHETLAAGMIQLARFRGRLRHHSHRGGADCQKSRSRLKPQLCGGKIPLDARICLEAGKGRGKGQRI